MSVATSSPSSSATMAPEVCIYKRYLLPEGFYPSADDIMIGRGKRYLQHNEKFYKIIETEMEEYKAAGSKALKSLILVRVLKHIKEVVKGKFVKPDATTGRWFEVEDSLARTTIAQAFRDSLHTSYRSSKQFKQRKRKQAKVTTTSPSKPSSSSTSETLMTAFDCSRMAQTANKKRRVSCVSPLQDATLPLLRSLAPVEPSSSADDPMLRLRDILDSASDMTTVPMDEIPSQDQQDLAAGPKSGAFNAFKIANAWHKDLMVSSTLFSLLDNIKEEGNPFEPTPLQEGVNQEDELSVLGDLDVDDLQAALWA